MFKQVKSALFWYYLYKFRKRVTLILFLLILALFANSIYSDVVEYLKLKDKLQYLELAFALKWGTILCSITISIYLLLTLFKKSEKEQKSKEEIKKEIKEEKIVQKQSLSKREEKFLKKEFLNSKAENLVKR